MPSVPSGHPTEGELAAGLLVFQARRRQRSIPTLVALIAESRDQAAALFYNSLRNESAALHYQRKRKRGPAICDAGQSPQTQSAENVLIALADVRKGEQINLDTQTYTLESAVPAKLKFSTEVLAPGASVRLYRILVGKAAKPIRPGGRFTTNNLHHKAASFHAKNQRLSLDAARRATPQDRLSGVRSGKAFRT